MERPDDRAEKAQADGAGEFGNSITLIYAVFFVDSAKSAASRCRCDMMRIEGDVVEKSPNKNGGIPMKKLLSIALSLCLLLSVALADVTLTKVYKTEDLVSNTFHNGFVTAIGMTGENTVVLKDDGTYEYTKRLMQTAEDGTVAADLVYTFTGTYTKDGDTVVLMFPTAGTASENWGPLAGSYFQNTENASFADSDYAAGVVQCKEAESHLIADLFEGPYLLDSLTTSDAAFDAEECTVTITVSGDTFDYVITNSDDD
jgi:hypothetical protein